MAFAIILNSKGNSSSYKNEDGGVLELLDGSEVGVGPHRKNELIELLSRI